jgi:hypothetical protein
MKHTKVLTVFLAFALCATVAWADQIILKNGQRYSGKFVRGDASVVEFRILGRIESFKTDEVSQILFQEPELTRPPASKEAAVAAPAAPAQPLPAPKPAPAAAAKPAAAPAPNIAGSSVTFPAGTSLTVRTTTVIDTDRNRVGDEFTATLEDPLMSGDQVVVPRGAEVKGMIANAKESGKLTGQSELILELTEIKVNGKAYLLRTSDYSEVGADRGRQTATTVGGGAALGAIIGAIAGGGKGAAVGAATGAAVGTGVQVLTKGQTLKVPAETLLDFRLERDLVIDRQ